MTKAVTMMEGIMNNQKTMFELVKSMSGQANILTVPRAYIELMGSIDGALLLSQIIYWSDKGDGGWFYKKYAEWEEEIHLSKYKVKKQIDIMVAAGFLETKTKKDPHGTPVVFYKFDPVAFQEWAIDKMTNNDNPENQKTSEQKVKNLTLESQKTLQWKVKKLYSPL